MLLLTTLGDDADLDLAALKLFPNLVLVGTDGDKEAAAGACGLLTGGAPSGDDGLSAGGMLLASVAEPPATAAVEDEGSLLRPAKSCLLDLRVVDELAGRRVVVLELGAGVVLVVVLLPPPADDDDLVALNRVWNLLFRLPNLRRVDALISLADSVEVATAGWPLPVGCSLLPPTD